MFARSSQAQYLSTLHTDVHTTEYTRMIPSALTPAVLSQQDAVFYEQNALEPQGKLNLRNCIVHHDAFLQLLDHPTTAPLAWQILG